MNAFVAPGPPRAGPMACARLLGRDDERRRVEQFVDGLAGGPETLVIVGEPGIGKTTLWEDALAHARGRGVQVRAVRPAPDDRGRPGSTLAELFGPPGQDAGGAGSATPAFDQGRRTLEALRRLAAGSPVLLGVDDAHRLDTESANALRFAFDRLTGEPVGLLVTWSETPDGEPAPVGARQARQLHLGPLPVEVLRQVLSKSLPAVSRPDLTRAHALSGGNPTVALDLVRTWQQERHGGARPARDHSLARHLLDLPEDAAALVRTLAVAGPSPAGVIAAAAGVADFDRAARPAVDAEVVQVGDDLTMRFTQPRYATAVLATVNPLDRRVVHARLAELVTAPEARALHLARSSLVADEPVAAHLEEIGGRCSRSGRPDVAAELYNHAARLTPPDHPDAAARRTLAEVTARAAAGETARALALADRLLATLPPGRQRAEAVTQRVFLDFGDSERFLRQALDHVDGDPALRARILDLLGWQLGLYRGRLVEGIAASTAALAAFTEAGDDGSACLAEAALAAQLTLHGQPCDDLFLRAIEHAAGAALSPLGRWPKVFRARALLWAGHLEEARRSLRLMQKEAAARGSEFQRPYRLHDLALLDVLAGDLDAAVSGAGEGIEAARDAGNEQAVVWLAHPLGLAAALQGDGERARWAAGLLVDWGVINDEAPRLAMADEILGNLAATHGDWSGALHHFTATARRLTDMGYAHPGARPALPRAVEAAAMTGDRDLLATLTQQLAGQAAALAVPLVDAQLEAARGQLALVDGERECAVDRLDAAVTALDRLGYRFDAARAGLALARGWLRCGQRAQARRAAERARAAFAAASAPQWVAAADDLLSRSGAGGPSGSLTRTEAQIAGLVAAGRMNREIAAELFLSVSTVEAHLTRIYRKLDLRGRTDLAGWLHSTAAP